MQVLLEDIGVARKDQRLWSPHVGYICVDESWFQKAAKLRFPIPRLITSHCSWGAISLPQLTTSSTRIAVSLMVIAAEIDISMSVRVFEEMTCASVQEDTGYMYTKMLLACNIVTGHPSNSHDWQLYYFRVKQNEMSFQELATNCSVLWNKNIGRLQLLLIGRLLHRSDFCFSFVLALY